MLSAIQWGCPLCCTRQFRVGVMADLEPANYAFPYREAEQMSLASEDSNSRLLLLRRGGLGYNRYLKSEKPQRLPLPPNLPPPLDGSRCSHSLLYHRGGPFLSQLG